MHKDSISQAAAACEALCLAAGAAADAGDADAFADLYIADGVFNRLGHSIKGRDAIRNVIASRPAGMWTRHRYTNARIEVAADGRSARGRVDLELDRGREGSTDIERVQAEHDDVFVLTEQGWRFASRSVVIKP